jgi:hypothetical protein
MKNKIHNWLIKSLISEGSLSFEDIDQINKKVSLGMFGIKEWFMEPKERFYLSILVNFYNYKCCKITILINLK